MRWSTPFLAMLEAYDPAAVPMPAGVPEPGIYADGALDRQARSAADLASVATGWTMLHEIAHIQHQQEGTGAPQGASRDMIHDEELSCDAFATTYMLERAEDYAEAEGVEARRVHDKRQIGVYFALFAMALICAGRRAESETHPALRSVTNDHLMLLLLDGDSDRCNAMTCLGGVGRETCSALPHLIV
jgi:Peptidase U49